jgi:hypothetical protein
LGHAVEKIKKGQLLKPPASNSSSVDGVDNQPWDPVRHTSVSGHALGGGNSDSKRNAGRRFRINGSKRRQVRREKAAFRNPAGSEQIDAEAFKSFDASMQSLGHSVIRNARGKNQRYFWEK